MIDDTAAELRFHHRRAELADALASLLGRAAPAPEPDRPRAAAVAADARGAYTDAASLAWAVVRREWRGDDRAAAVALAQAIGERVGSRAAWLVLAGPEPQAVEVASDVVLDNPAGFVSLGGGFTLFDRAVPAGLTLVRHAGDASGTEAWWELEAWGAEPWLSAATRAVREEGRG